MQLHDLWLFVLACISLNLLPGVDTIYIVSRSIAEGKRAGVISALGISTGTIFHICAVTFGLSALIFSFSYAFSIVKTLGAMYLFYLGIKMLLKKASSPQNLHFSKRKEGDWKIFKQAVLTNVLNPKVALFFMAFLPQFVPSEAEYKVMYLLMLGAIFLTTGTIWCLILALFSSRFALKVQESKKASMIVNKVVGIIFIALGGKLLLEKN